MYYSHGRPLLCACRRGVLCDAYNHNPYSLINLTNGYSKNFTTV